MTKEDKKQTLQEWIAQEEARLKKGFEYTPKPTTSSGPDSVEQAMAGLGIGAGVVGGALGPHTNPVTFDGVRASVLTSALKSELAADDSRVQVERTADSTVVTILLSQAGSYQFRPALTVTLLESPDTLTVTLGNLDKDVVRGAWASIGGKVVEQGKDLLLRRRGVGGMLDAAGDLIENINDVTETVDDLALPRQVWAVIDRVCGAAEEAYHEEKHKERQRQRLREETERAWTHCPSCGRAYRPEETERVDCSSCGASRGTKPDWL